MAAMPFLRSDADVTLYYYVTILTPLLPLMPHALSSMTLPLLHLLLTTRDITRAAFMFTVDIAAIADVGVRYAITSLC